MRNLRQIVRILLPLSIVVGGIAVGIYLSQRQQIIQNRAAPLCQPLATCRWDIVQDGLTYRYAIVDLTFDTSVKMGTTTDSFVTFNVLPLHRYDCRVKAVNECGESEVTTGSATCRNIFVPSPTSIGGVGGVPNSSTSATVNTDASASATPAETASSSAEIESTPTESVQVDVALLPTTEQPTEVPTQIPPTVIPADIPTPMVSKPFLIANSTLITSATRILSYISFGFVLITVGLIVYRRKKRS